MAKKPRTKSYEVCVGYHTLVVGSLTACQRVQAAIAACQAVEVEFLETGDGRQVVNVLSDPEVVVRPAKERTLTQEEYRRESTLKIGHTPSDQVKGGVV